MRRLVLCLLAIGSFLADAAILPSLAFAQDVGIAAVVNDSLISRADVDARVKLALLNANAPPDEQTRQRLAKEVMRQLIDETLEAQEAKREGVTLDTAEVQREYAELEHQNKMPPGGLEKFLGDHGISKQVLIDQITNRWLWTSVVRGRYGPQLTVGDDEVNAKIKDIKAHADAPANRVAEIFLPVAEPSQDAEVAAGAQRLVDAIKHGASFPDLARQFSQGSSAATGGDLGWSASGSLPPEIEKIVDRMQPSTMDGPVRLTGGYYILALIDRRSGSTSDNVRYSLTQAVFPLPATATEADAMAVARKAKAMTQDMRSCEEINALGGKLSPDLSGPIGELTLAQMPPGLRPLVEKAKVAVPFDPVPVRGGIGIFMLCGKSGGDMGIDHTAVENALSEQKFESVSQRYLQELRRTAYIVIHD